MAKNPMVRVEKTKYGTYRLEYRNPDGRRMRTSAGKDYDRANRLAVKYSDWLLEGKDPEREIERARQQEKARSITLRQLFPSFMEKHGSKRAPKTRLSYETSWKHIRQYREIADIPLCDLSVDLVESYVRTRREKVGANTVRIEAQFIQAIMSFALKQGLIEVHPLRGRLELPRKPSKRIVRLSPAELSVLVNAMPEQSVKDIVEFAIYTGRRKEEILGLRIENVRIKEMEYSTLVKGGEWETFRASEYASEVLKRAIGNRREGFVFLNPRTGSRYPENSKVHGYDGAVRRLKLFAIQDGEAKKLTFHDLRHVFATGLTDAGANIRDVQALMGHKSVTITEVYTAPSRGMNALKLQQRID